MFLAIRARVRRALWRYLLDRVVVVVASWLVDAASRRCPAGRRARKWPVAKCISAHFDATKVCLFKNTPPDLTTSLMSKYVLSIQVHVRLAP